MIHRIYKPEILAPCGSYDILVAAVKAGADACYIGGSRFGARAYAENLDSDSVIKAIDYAHNHGVKLYLTVNTLIKNNEIKEIGKYLQPYYEAGLDAVIVQDLGVFLMVRQLFPDMHIHCSTQMNINSVHGARFMHEQGASRVVTAREMSLDEIKAIKRDVDIEIETFVHGAMCYSYSGQCLLSSVSGERSGNRGRCAQPCRKCYDGEYSLSMKDMCALELLPELFAAGIDSFKIEGRMKNAYYVASAVDAYSQMRDDCVAGRFDVNKAESLKLRLANIYNRGGFTDGYFFRNKQNASETCMISKDRPNNRGVVLGQLKGISSGKIRLELQEDMYRGDVLEIRLKDGTTMDVTVGTDGKKGMSVDIPAPKTKQIVCGQSVLRTRCNKILEEVERDILCAEDSSHKIRLHGMFCAIVGKPLSLTLYREIDGKKYEVTVQGDVVAPADKHGADAVKLKEKISQLGGTEYYMAKLNMDVSEDAFVPLGLVKQLRRDAIDDLEKEISQSFRRKKNDLGTNSFDFREKTHDEAIADSKVQVGVLTTQQLDAILEFSCVDGVYLERKLYDVICGNGMIDRIKEKKINVYLTLPYIINSHFSIGKYLPNSDINGIYIRNIDGFATALHEDILKEYKCVCAASLYGYNNMARQYMLKFYPKLIFELPKELTLAECGSLAPGEQEFNLYGYQQVMLSAQCVRKNRKDCNRNNEIIPIRDDRGNRFFSRCVCEECCNVIYNGIPFDMIKRRREIDDCIHPKRYNLFFTIEDGKQTTQIMQELTDSLLYQDTHMIQKESKIATTGHCYRGVE